MQNGSNEGQCYWLGIYSELVPTCDNQNRAKKSYPPVFIVYSRGGQLIVFLSPISNSPIDCGLDSNLPVRYSIV